MGQNLGETARPHPTGVHADVNFPSTKVLPPPLVEEAIYTHTKVVDWRLRNRLCRDTSGEEINMCGMHMPIPSWVSSQKGERGMIFYPIQQLLYFFRCFFFNYQFF